MTMKVTTLNFIKEIDVPHREANTEFSRIVTQVSETLKRGIPKGQALPLKLEGAKKYTRYQLQKRLQKLGHKIQVRGSGKNLGELFIVNASE